MVKKEVFMWIESGMKTIDIRKGKPFRGNIATFMCGPKLFRLLIEKTETGTLNQIIHPDNYKSIIPTAYTVQDVHEYLKKLYVSIDSTFTAYYLTKN